MKGINILRLNHATVLEAVQEYLSKRMVGEPLVVGIGAGECTTWNAYSTADQINGMMEVRFQDPVGFLKGEKT
jgi:hypothetical protein